MNEYIERIVLSEEEIKEHIRSIAERLNQEYKAVSEPIVLITVLEGASVFSLDLVPLLSFSCESDECKVKSYEKDKSSGKYVMKKEISSDIKGKKVVIIEDIYDTGGTLDFLIKHCFEKGASSVGIAVLLSKEEGREIDVEKKAKKGIYAGKVKMFKGPEIQGFVIGYGLDYREHCRDLPYVGIISEHGKKEIDKSF